MAYASNLGMAQFKLLFLHFKMATFDQRHLKRILKTVIFTKVFLHVDIILQLF